MIINNPSKTAEDIIREYLERKKAAGIKPNIDAGAGNPPDIPKAVSIGDYIKLENIACTGADKTVFESYPELYVSTDVCRDDKKQILILKPYDAIVHCESKDQFTPSFALSCNIMARLYNESIEKLANGQYKIKDAKLESVLKQYKDKGNGNGWHAQNTIVNWGAKQIIHYPHDYYFPNNGGSANINSSQNSIILTFDNNGFADKILEDALQIRNFESYIKNLTGLQDPSILVDIGKYFGKTARIWVYSSNETRACWLGCFRDNFYLSSNCNLFSTGAVRGVRKKIP